MVRASKELNIIREHLPDTTTKKERRRINEATKVGAKFGQGKGPRQKRWKTDFSLPAFISQLMRTDRVLQSVPGMARQREAINTALIRLGVA